MTLTANAFPLTTIGGGINRLRTKAAADRTSLYDLLNGYVTQANTIKVRPGTLRTANIAAYDRYAPVPIAPVPGDWPPLSILGDGWAFQGETSSTTYEISDSDIGLGTPGPMSAALNGINPGTYPNTAILVAFELAVTQNAPGLPNASSITATLGGFSMQVAAAITSAPPFTGENPYNAIAVHLLLPFVPGTLPHADLIVTVGGTTYGIPANISFVTVLTGVDPLANLALQSNSHTAVNTWDDNGAYIDEFGVIAGPPPVSKTSLPPLPVIAAAGDFIVTSFAGAGASGPGAYDVSFEVVGDTGFFGTPVTNSANSTAMLTTLWAGVSAAGQFQAVGTAPYETLSGGSAAILTTLKAFTLPVNGAPLTTQGVTRGLVYYNGTFHVFSSTLVGVPPDFTLHVLAHPSSNALVNYPIKEIHFATPYLGGLYVVAEFEVPTYVQDSVGSVFHYWIQGNATTWAADTDHSIGDVIVPTVPNGYIYVASRSFPSEPVWQPNTQEQVGNIIEPTVPNGFGYVCIATAGTNPATGGSEPTWPTLDGATVTEFVTLDNSQSPGGATAAANTPVPTTPPKYAGLYTKPT